VVNLRIDTVEMAGGARAAREVVEHADVVAIVPLQEDGDVLLVRQYRLPTEQVMLEVPAGGVDAGETPEEAAQRELREECGRGAGCLERLGGFYVSPGFTNEFVHVFLATELESSPRLVSAGEIRDAKSIIGLTWAAAKVHRFTIE